MSINYNDYLETPETKNTEYAFNNIERRSTNLEQVIPLVYGFKRVEGITLWAGQNVAEVDSPYPGLVLVLALSIGECQGIKNVYFDDQLVELTITPTHNTWADCKGIFAGSKIQFNDGRDTKNSIAGIAWNYGRKKHITDWNGICTLEVLLKNTGNFKEVPKISVDLYGRKCRSFSTGAKSWSNNPANIISDLLQDPIYGKNVSYTNLDASSFNNVITSCNAARTNTSPSQNIWTANVSLNPQDGLNRMMNTILEPYLMNLIYAQGKYKLLIEQSPAVTGLTIDNNVIIGDVSVGYPGINYRYNRVSVKYPEPLYNENFVTVSWPTFRNDASYTYLADDNNQPLEQTLQVTTVTNSREAADIAQMILLRSRNQIVYRFRASRAMYQFQVGDLATLNVTTPYINNQSVYITRITLLDDLTCQVEAVLWSSTFYPNYFSNAIDPPSPGVQVIPGPQGGYQPPGYTEPIVAPATPVYAWTNIPRIIKEGTSGTFSISGTGVTNGTQVKYKILAIPPTQLSVSDFVSTTEGIMTFTSGAASVSISVASDATTEGPESFEMQILNIQTGAQLLSAVFSVEDTSVSPAANPISVTISGLNTLTDTNWYIGDFYNDNVSLQKNTQTQNPAGIDARVIQGFSWDPKLTWAYVNIRFVLTDRLRNSQSTDRNVYYAVESVTAGPRWMQWNGKSNPTFDVVSFDARTPNSLLPPTVTQQAGPGNYNGLPFNAQVFAAGRLQHQLYSNTGTYVYTNGSGMIVPILQTPSNTRFINSSDPVAFGTFWIDETPLTSKVYRFHFWEYNTTAKAVKYIGYKDTTWDLTATAATNFISPAYVAGSRTAYNSGHANQRTALW
jgi:hypothetical protein